MSPMPVVSDFTTEVYGQQHMFNASDEANGWSLLYLNDAFCAPFVAVDDLVRDDETEGTTGWEKLYDPDLVPIEHLGYLAAFVGVQLLPGLPEAEQRERVKSTDGFNRGTPAAMVAAAKQFLTGTKFVKMVERYDIDNPTLDSAYHLYFATKPGETPNQQQVLAALIAQKPAGLVLRYTVSGPTDTYEGVVAYHATYQTVFDTYATYGAIQDDPTYYDGFDQKWGTYNASDGQGTYDNPT